MSTYQKLKAQMSKLEQQVEAARKKEAQAVIERIKTLMAEFGLTAADLTRSGGATKSVRGAPKYADPKSGATWSGKGRAPNWIAAAVKDGHADRFLIQKPKPKSPPSAKPVAAKPVATKPVAPKAAAAPVKKPAVKVPSVKKPAVKAAKAAPKARRPTPKKPVRKPAVAASPAAAPTAAAPSPAGGDKQAAE